MAPTILSLPGELRNTIYDLILDELEDLIVSNGQVVPHPFSQVCHQTRLEFGSMFDARSIGKELKPTKTILQIENFDFENSVQALERSVDTSKTIFDIRVKVTKQLDRDDWSRIWPWVRFCDSMAESAAQRSIQTSYNVCAKLGACNPYAACHMLYVEIVPYILKGGAGVGQCSAGYQQVEKIRAALSGSFVWRI